MMVSIIIPNFNGARYINECLESCLSQGPHIKEIIVIDDHSSDESLKILTGYAERFPEIIQVYINPGRGACSARNYGYRKSSGEFIQFLDSDDVLAPQKIESQLEVLLGRENYKHLLVHAKWGRFTEKVDEVYFWGPDKSIRKDLKPIDWFVANHMSMTGCWLTPRNLIEKGGLWNESLLRNQDGEFFYRIMLNATEVLFCEESKVYYRSLNFSSISSSKERKAMESLYKSLLLIEKYILDLENSERTRLTVANRFQDFVYFNYISYPELSALAEKKVAVLGGSDLKLPGGKVLRAISNVMGWKNALRLKKLITKRISL